MREIQVGLLGFGNVGGGIWKLLEDIAPQIAHREGLRFTIKRVLVRNSQKKREVEISAELFTDRPEDVLLDPDITLVVECLGGDQPATEYMLEAMRHGKTVVTANKVALATNWHLLQKQAIESGVGLYYEASAAAAIPVVAAMQYSLQANRIDCLMGIINGTTNYILSRMSQEGSSYADALAQAQQLGFAEPDPTADVDGFDAVYKLSILSSLAFHAHVPVQEIYREGITGVTDLDIACGKEMGLVLKLLAVAKRDGQTVEVRVHPTFVPETHQLAAVNGAYNAVFLHGSACGDMMLYGSGAGDMPTASAVVSDMVRAAEANPHRHPTFANNQEAPDDLCFLKNWRSVFFLRLWAADRPGVLAEIAGRFAGHDVSIASMIQRADRREADGRVSLVFVTHEAGEQDVRAALAEIEDSTAQIASVIRVEQ